MFAANDMIFCGTETGLIKVSSKQINFVKRLICFSEDNVLYKTFSNVTAGLDSIVNTRSKKNRGRLNNHVNAKESWSVQET